MSLGVCVRRGSDAAERASSLLVLRAAPCIVLPRSALNASSMEINTGERFCIWENAAGEEGGCADLPAESGINYLLKSSAVAITIT